MPDLWTYTDFNAEYSLELSATIGNAVLTDAEITVQDYVTAAVWADAIAAVPDDQIAYYKIRRAVGDLATVYLRQRNLTAPVADAYSESYGSVVKYELSSKNSLIGDSMTEAAILGRLTEYADTTTNTFTPGVSWGTGRWVGVISTDDDA